MHFGVYNGDGYSRAEANDQKSFQVRGDDSAAARWQLPRQGAPRARCSTTTTSRSRAAPSGPLHRQRVVRARRFNAGFDYLTGADQTLPTTAKVEVDGYRSSSRRSSRKRATASRRCCATTRSGPTRTSSARQNRCIAGVAVLVPAPGRQRDRGAAARLRAGDVRAIHHRPSQAAADRAARPDQFLTGLRPRARTARNEETQR